MEVTTPRTCIFLFTRKLVLSMMTWTKDYNLTELRSNWMIEMKWVLVQELTIDNFSGRTHASLIMTASLIRNSMFSSAYQWRLHDQLAVLSLGSQYGIAGITVFSSQYGIAATVACCAKKSGKCRSYSLVDTYLEPGVPLKLALISDGSLAAKFESVHPHLVLNFRCHSHVSSESIKSLRNQVYCRTPKAHVQCLPVLHHQLQCPLTSLCLRHHSQHQRRYNFFVRHR